MLAIVLLAALSAEPDYTAMIASHLAVASPARHPGCNCSPCSCANCDCADVLALMSGKQSQRTDLSSPITSKSLAQRELNANRYAETITQSGKARESADYTVQCRPDSSGNMVCSRVSQPAKRVSAPVCTGPNCKPAAPRRGWRLFR